MELNKSLESGFFPKLTKIPNKQKLIKNCVHNFLLVLKYFKCYSIMLTNHKNSKIILIDSEIVPYAINKRRKFK
jgi:hypothetical protein